MCRLHAEQIGHEVGYTTAAIRLWASGQRKAAAWLMLRPDARWDLYKRDLSARSYDRLCPILRYAEKLQAREAAKMSHSDSAN